MIKSNYTECFEARGSPIKSCLLHIFLYIFNYITFIQAFFPLKPSHSTWLINPNCRKKSFGPETSSLCFQKEGKRFHNSSLTTEVKTTKPYNWIFIICFKSIFKREKMHIIGSSPIMKWVYLLPDLIMNISKREQRIRLPFKWFKFVSSN